MSNHILVILGSVRAGRIAPQVGRWVMENRPASSTLGFELIDLRDWRLPMDDEPGIPARVDYYTQSYSEAWSRKVTEAAGYIFVTPEYNGSYPAALKNALDHLYREWTGKPVSIVTYGYHGGGRVAVQLRQLLETMKMAPVKTMPALTITQDMHDADGQLTDPDHHFADNVGVLHQSIDEMASSLR
ncbi:NAD(P)H-dependent oxidoreductase [Kozakia baliensis]|uniref:NADPH-dependent FMN reductase n=1 Tax=Kozakia baliensis TaxID=153496 RepID=UPI00345B5C88